MRVHLQHLVAHAAGTVASYVLLIPVFVAMLCGRVRVTNYWSALGHIRRGRLLIISNHPSLVETVAIPALFWWLAWGGAGRLVPWSLADEHLFRYRWLYPSFRCIPVQRGVGASRRENARALRQVLDWWNQERPVILYPEGGRTSKGDTFYECGGRVVRVPDIAVVALAARHGVPIMPVWVEQPTALSPESMFRGYLRMFFRSPLRIRFGEPQRLMADQVTPALVADVLLRV